MHLYRIIASFIAFRASHGQHIRHGHWDGETSSKKEGQTVYSYHQNGTGSTLFLPEIQGDELAHATTTRRLMDPLQLPVFLSAALDDTYISHLTPAISSELMLEVMKLININFSNVRRCGTEGFLWMDIPWCVKFKSMNMQSYDSVTLWNRASGDSSSFITVVQGRVVRAKPIMQVSLGGGCAVDFDTTGDFILSSLTLQLRVGISDDGKILNIDAEDVTVGNMQLDIDPRYNSACSIVNFPITKVLDIYAQDIVNNQDQRRKMSASATTALSLAVRNSKAFINETTIKFSDEGKLTIVPAISKLRKDTHLLTETHVSFYAELTSPAWRSGYGYQPTFHVTGELPQTGNDHVANINVRASGINALIDSLWYISWASIATNPAGKFSSLSCHAEAARSLMDPCPYPAYIHDACALGGPFCTILLGGIFSSQVLSHVVLPPPRFVFDSGQIIGKAYPSVAIVTTSLLREETVIAELSVDCTIKATIPTFDTSNGTFSGLEITSIDIATPILSKQTGLFNFAGDRLVSLSTEAVEQVIQFFLPKINTLLTDTLKGAPPLILPTIENAPLDNTAIMMRFSGSSTIEGYPESVQGESYLYFGSDVSVNVRPMQPINLLNR